MPIESDGPGAGPHRWDQPIRGAPPPGAGAIRMRQRDHCYPKSPSSSPDWVRQLLVYRPAPSLGLSVRVFRPDVLAVKRWIAGCRTVGAGGT